MNQRNRALMSLCLLAATFLYHGAWGQCKLGQSLLEIDFLNKVHGSNVAQVRKACVEAGTAIKVSNINPEKEYMVIFTPRNFDATITLYDGRSNYVTFNDDNFYYEIPITVMSAQGLQSGCDQIDLDESNMPSVAVYWHPVNHSWIYNQFYIHVSDLDCGSSTDKVGTLQIVEGDAFLTKNSCLSEMKMIDSQNPPTFRHAIPVIELFGRTPYFSFSLDSAMLANAFIGNAVLESTSSIALHREAAKKSTPANGYWNGQSETAWLRRDELDPPSFIINGEDIIDSSEESTRLTIPAPIQPCSDPEDISGHKFPIKKGAAPFEDGRLNRTLVLGYQAMATGNYSIDWASPPQEPDCPTGLLIFEDPKLHTFGQVMGVTISYHALVNQQDSIRSKEPSHLTWSGLVATADNQVVPYAGNYAPNPNLTPWSWTSTPQGISNPQYNLSRMSICNTHGGGGLKRVLSSSSTSPNIDICCGETYHFDAEKVYYLVFATDSCCDFCLDEVRLKYCGTEDQFDANKGSSFEVASEGKLDTLNRYLNQVMLDSENFIHPLSCFGHATDPYVESLSSISFVARTNGYSIIQCPPGLPTSSENPPEIYTYLDFNDASSYSPVSGVWITTEDSSTCFKFRSVMGRAYSLVLPEGMAAPQVRALPLFGKPGIKAVAPTDPVPALRSKPRRRPARAVRPLQNSSPR